MLSVRTSWAAEWWAVGLRAPRGSSSSLSRFASAGMCVDAEETDVDSVSRDSVAGNTGIEAETETEALEVGMQAERDTAMMDGGIVTHPLVVVGH